MSNVEIGVWQNDREANERTEDGFHVVVADFWVVATFPNGKRFSHKVRFCGHADHNEDGFGYAVHGDKDSADDLARRAEEHIARGGELNLDRWDEIDPAYGSEEYEVQDAGGYFAFRERQADENEVWA